MALWTPALFDLVAWYDADDSDTITIDTGVSEWRNKIGNNYTLAQATGAYQPTLVSDAIGGTMPTLEFDGSGDVLTYNSSIIPNTYTIFVISKNRNLSATSVILVQGTTGASGRFGAYGERNASNFRGFQQVDGTGHTYAGTRSGDYVIHGYQRNGTTSRIRWNGITDDGSVASDAIQQTSFQVGAGFSGWYPVDVSEIIVLDGFLDEDTCKRFEGYLAHKWGLAANLEASHPYKTNAPVALSFFGAIRDKTGTLASGRGVRAIREADQVCVAFGTSNVSGEYDIGVLSYGIGTVTTASASVITDSAKAWTVDEFEDHYGVRMTSGTQSGEWRRITSNTATALTLASALPGTTAINDTFEIAPLHTLVFSGESDRNALVYSGLMPKEPPE